MPQVWKKQSSENPSRSGLLCPFRNQQQCSVLMGLYFTYSLNACTATQGDKNLESLTKNCCLYVWTSVGIVVHSVGLSLWRKAYLSLFVFIQRALKIIAVILLLKCLMCQMLSAARAQSQPCGKSFNANFPDSWSWGSSTGALAPKHELKMGNAGRMQIQIFDNTSLHCSFNPRPRAVLHKSQEMLSHSI